MKIDLDKAHEIRRRMTLAPESVDMHERAMMNWPGALREVDLRFRTDGVFQPFGCSSKAFDTVNP